MLNQIPFLEYTKIQAVNWSTLKNMRKSPLHYWHGRSNPWPDTPRLALGRATHTAVLEPDKFESEYAVYDGDRRAGKSWESFVQLNQGRTIIKLDEYHACMRMRDAVRRHPVARQYLKEGKSEVSATWVDKETGIECKSRIDWLGPVLFDLKTTKDITAGLFSASVARMGYHAQVAFGSQGVVANGGPAPELAIVAVEAEAPHDVAVYALNDDVIYAGEQELARLLRLVKNCRATDEWPGRYRELQELHLPSWAFDEQEESELIIGDE